MTLDLTAYLRDTSPTHTSVPIPLPESHIIPRTPPHNHTRTDKGFGKHLVQLGSRERPGIFAGLVKGVEGRLQVTEDLDNVAFALPGEGLFGPTQCLNLHDAVLLSTVDGGKLVSISSASMVTKPPQKCAGPHHLALPRN